MMARWHGLRLSDRISMALVLVALGTVLAGVAYAQTPPSQESFNGRIDATVAAMDKRIERLESALNYSVGVLVMNLMAHLFQISTQLKRRREQDDDEPRVRER